MGRVRLGVVTLLRLLAPGCNLRSALEWSRASGLWLAEILGGGAGPWGGGRCARAAGAREVRGRLSARLPWSRCRWPLAPFARPTFRQPVRATLYDGHPHPHRALSPSRQDLQAMDPPALTRAGPQHRRPLLHLASLVSSPTV